jgi:hypothetical protein
MPPIGETLREARLRRKVEIAEVETATKIRAKYLRALENEEFERLPGSTYARTFLRTYAEYLGLDPHLLVEEYRVRHEPAPDEEAPPLAPPPPRRRRPEAARPQPGGRTLPAVRAPSPGAIAAGIAVAVLLLFLVIGLVSGDDDEPVDGPPAADESKQGDGRGKQRDEPQRERPPEPKRVELRISPVDATYVCIDDGSGARVFEGTLTAPRTFRARSLRLNLGKTSAQVEANGERVKIEQGTTPVGFEFTPEGQEELPLGERPCA